MDGGVFGLLGLIRRDRGAVEYDLRHRFGLGLRDVGSTITIFELARLVVIIRNDPSSMIAAAVEGWAYPMARAVAVLADLYDLTHAAAGAKKPKPYPRPWETKRSEKRYGDTGGRTRAEVVAILNGLGHQLPV